MLSHRGKYISYSTYLFSPSQLKDPEKSDAGQKSLTHDHCEWRSYQYVLCLDGDVEAHAPDLRSLLAVPPPADDVFARWDIWNLQLVHNVELEHMVPHLVVVSRSYRNTTSRWKLRSRAIASCRTKATKKMTRSHLVCDGRSKLKACRISHAILLLSKSTTISRPAEGNWIPCPCRPCRNGSLTHCDQWDFCTVSWIRVRQLWNFERRQIGRRVCRIHLAIGRRHPLNPLFVASKL